MRGRPEAQHILKWLLVTGCLVFGVAVVDRALFWKFAPPVHHLQEVSDSKVYQLRDLINNGVDYDVVVIGSSIAHSGLSPSVFKDATGRSVMNAGLAGNFIASRTVKVLRDSFTQKRPRLIIYQIENFALGEKATPGSLQNPPKDRLVDLLFAHRYRVDFAEWLVAALKGEAPPLPADKPETIISRRFKEYHTARSHPDGWLEVEAVADTKFVPKVCDCPYHPEQLSALREIIDVAKDFGSEIVIVQFPLHVSAINGEEKRLRRFSSFVQNIAASRGIRFIDFVGDSAFPFRDKAYFYDVNHLNKNGARAFTGLLAARLKEKH